MCTLSRGCSSLFVLMFPRSEEFKTMRKNFTGAVSTTIGEEMWRGLKTESQKAGALKKNSLHKENGVHFVDLVWHILNSLHITKAMIKIVPYN